jgi:ABC-type nitrate/sulfonate/bicarbonate transport system ATPase subunit/GNAT superfamily N-acetyltransferase
MTRKTIAARHGVETYIVASAIPKSTYRKVHLVDKVGRKLALNVHRFALVGPRETVAVNQSVPSKVCIVSSEDSGDFIPLSPHFVESKSLLLGAVSFPLRVEELSAEEQLQAYSFLEAFHYKTTVFTQGDDGDELTNGRSAGMGGRRAVLLASLKVGGRWEPVGYIELQMPLLMVKPRHELFSPPFDHPNRPVKWTEWNAGSIRSFVNLIARVARVVTSPEYRGLGLARELLGSAEAFARSRWHIGGRRALFLEISAEMLRYLDFVSSSGFVFAGNTEGNLDRIVSDMTSMRRGYSVSSGIMSLQKKYLTRIEEGAARLGKPIDAVIESVSACAADPELLNQLNPQEYFVVRSVLRLPIPYFIKGLDEYSQDYVERGAARLAKNQEQRRPFVGKLIERKAKATRVSWKRISVTAEYDPPVTPSVRGIIEAFGLQGTRLSIEVVKNLKIEASSGNIILVIGPSGTGKSLLLRALDPTFQSRHVKIHRKSERTETYSAGWMRDLPDEEPIIDVFARQWGVERSIHALNLAGLSEAFVYLKPYRLLSRGQRYRARLADLLVRPEQVWLLDEFCSDLDPLTAGIVASNFRKIIVRTQRVAFVAAANHMHFASALRPTRVLQLRHGFEPRIMGYREFSDSLRERNGKEV